MKKTTLAFVAISLAALLPLGCAAETEDGEKAAAAAQALNGNDLPVGSYYTLHMVGVPADKKPDLASNGSTMFVKLAGSTKVALSAGPFKVTDADGTDGAASLQLPSVNNGNGWGGGIYGPLNAPGGYGNGPIFGNGWGGYNPYYNGGWNGGWNSPYPGSPYAGSPYAGSPYPGSPYPGSPYAGSPYPGSPYYGSPYPGAPYPGSQPASLSRPAYTCFAKVLDAQQGSAQSLECDLTVDAIEGIALCRLPELSALGYNASSQDVSSSLLHVLTLINAAGATKPVAVFDNSFQDMLWQYDSEKRRAAEIRCYERQ